MPVLTKRMAGKQLCLIFDNTEGYKKSYTRQSDNTSKEEVITDVLTTQTVRMEVIPNNNCISM